MSVVEKIKSIFAPKDIPPDPVKHCHVHKTVGCSHVDGPLCDVRTCDVKVAVFITPNKMSTVEDVNQAQEENN
jgi:hypothetical protein